MCPQGLAGSDDQQHAEGRPRPGPARARWPRLHTRRRFDHPFEYEAAPYSHTELDGNNARLARPGGAHQADDRQNRGSFRARRGSRAKTPRWRPRRSVALPGRGIVVAIRRGQQNGQIRDHRGEPFDPRSPAAGGRSFSRPGARFGCYRPARWRPGRGSGTCWRAPADRPRPSARPESAKVRREPRPKTQHGPPVRPA